MYFFEETLSSITPSSLKRMGKLPEIHFKGEMGGALQDFVRSLEQLLSVQVSTLLERMRHTTLMLHEIGSWCVCLGGVGEKRGTREISPQNREILPFSPAWGLGPSPSLRVDNE